TLPSGLTAAQITGSGWTCTQPGGPCTRSDALAAGASYAGISLTVNVATGAPSSVTNSATVSGGGSGNYTANDPTTIGSGGAPVLTVAKSHSGNFTQGQSGVYTLTVSNTGSAGTSATVTLTDTLPGALTAAQMTGSGWTCSVSTVSCTRSDALAAGLSYSSVTLTVNVVSGAGTTVTNTATVSGGGAA